MKISYIIKAVAILLPFITDTAEAAKKKYPKSPWLHSRGREGRSLLTKKANLPEVVRNYLSFHERWLERSDVTVVGESFCHFDLGSRRLHQPDLELDLIRHRVRSDLVKIFVANESRLSAYGQFSITEPLPGSSKRMSMMLKSQDTRIYAKNEDWAQKNCINPCNDCLDAAIEHRSSWMLCRRGGEKVGWRMTNSPMRIMNPPICEIAYGCNTAKPGYDETEELCAAQPKFEGKLLPRGTGGGSEEDEKESRKVLEEAKEDEKKDEKEEEEGEDKQDHPKSN